MFVLGLNTAFAACNIALVDDGGIIADTTVPMVRGQDGALPSILNTLLRDVGKTLADLDRIAVVTGPGSFTGVRLGVSFARGLALALDIPCIGITSLEASVPHGMATNVLAALQAKKRPPDQTWWVQGIDEDGHGTAPVMEVDRLTLSDMLVGFKIPVFIDQSRGLGLSDKLDTRTLRPSAITAALKGAVFTPTDHPPAPVYARAPDAALPAAKG